MECLLPYLCMATVPHIMVGLERMLDYRGVGLVRFHCSRYSNITHSSSTWLLALSYIYFIEDYNFLDFAVSIFSAIT